MHRKIVAKILSIPYLMGIPKRLRQKVRELNVGVTQLERSKADLRTYVAFLSRVGGELFGIIGSSERNKTKLSRIGSNLIEVILLQDMIRDLSSDKVDGKFNPLKSYTFSEIDNLAELMKRKFDLLTYPLFNKIVLPSVSSHKWNFWSVFERYRIYILWRLRG